MKTLTPFLFASFNRTEHTMLFLPGPQYTLYRKWFPILGKKPAQLFFTFDIAVVANFSLTLKKIVLHKKYFFVLTSVGFQ